MPYFCTYFDHNYLSRGLTLYASLKRHSPDAVLYVLALSAECEEILHELALADMHIIPLKTLEAFDVDLAARKSCRSIVEYYFTLSPCWPRYLLRTVPEVDLLTYVDADCALFADPTPVLTEMDQGSIGIVGHRFPQRLKHHEQFGLYNVGWLSFRNNDEGMACLDWWRERCLEWCEDRLDNGRFADQGYLDQWPSLFAGLVEIQYPGVNVAPWNAERYAWTVNNDSICVDNVPLICYHFHSLRRRFWRFWSMGFASYRATPSVELYRSVYLSYVREVDQWENAVSHVRKLAATLARHRGRAGCWRNIGRVMRAARKHDLLISR